MPCDIGFHPFFRVADLHKVHLTVDGESFSLDKENYDLITSTGLLLKNVHCIDIEDKKGKLTLKTLKNLPNIFLWSGKPDKFLVVEPWSSYRNAINEGNNYFNITPGNSDKVIWEITIQTA